MIQLFNFTYYGNIWIKHRDSFIPTVSTTLTLSLSKISFIFILVVFLNLNKSVLTGKKVAGFDGFRAVYS